MGPVSIVPLTVPLQRRKIAVDTNPFIFNLSTLENAMIGTPKEGEGTRKLECGLYETCLDFAVKESWKSFNCDDCKYSDEDAVMPSPGEKTPPHLCEECGNKPRLGSSPYCASCMAIRGNRAKALKKAAEKLKKEKETKVRTKSETALRTADTALKIEFGKHAAVLREVEALADQEIRPVECQIIYMLKQQLSEKAHDSASAR